MSTHTPGPWTVQKRDDEERGTLVKHVGEFDDFFVCETNVSWRENARNAANARLIAAAPDLLEALKALVSAEDQYVDEVNAKLDDPISDAVETARAAIAKAEGGEA